MVPRYSVSFDLLVGGSEFIETSSSSLSTQYREHSSMPSLISSICPIDLLASRNSSSEDSTQTSLATRTSEWSGSQPGEDITWQWHAEKFRLAERLPTSTCSLSSSARPRTRLASRTSSRVGLPNCVRWGTGVPGYLANPCFGVSARTRTPISRTQESACRQPSMPYVRNVSTLR